MESTPKTRSFAMHGTEAFVLVWFIGILSVISVLTTASSVYFMFKFRLFPGSEVIQFQENGKVVFKHDIAIETMKLITNRLMGVQMVDGNILMLSGKSQISLGDEGIDIVTPHGLNVVSPKTKKQIFPVDFGSQPLPSSVSSLSMKSGAKNVKKIRSPIDHDLEISGGSVLVGGSQGVRVEGRKVEIDGHDVSISSRNGSIILNASDGIFMPALPVVSDDTVEAVMQYKLCICSKSGRVFRLHMKTADTTCADVRFPESVNPCI